MRDGSGVLEELGLRVEHTTWEGAVFLAREHGVVVADTTTLDRDEIVSRALDLWFQIPA